MKHKYTIPPSDGIFSIPDLHAVKSDSFNKEDNPKTCSQKEDEEVNRILAEMEDLPTDEPVEPPLPATKTQPINQGQSINLSSLTVQELLEKQKGVFEHNPNKYSEKERELNRDIAIELTSRGVPPVDREYRQPTTQDCKKDSDHRNYSNDLQVFDLQWVWFKHRGYKVDKKERGGLYAGIFESDEFNFKLAEKIAIGKYTKKDGNTRHLTHKQKIEDLGLDHTIQRQLSVFLSTTIKDERRSQRDKKYKKDKKLKGFKVESKNVETELFTHKQNTPRASLDIEKHVNVWVAFQFCKKSNSYLSDTMKKYEELTGKPINKSTLRDKLKTLKKIGRV